MDEISRKETKVPSTSAIMMTMGLAGLFVRLCFI